MIQNILIIFFSFLGILTFVNGVYLSLASDERRTGINGNRIDTLFSGVIGIFICGGISLIIYNMKIYKQEMLVCENKITTLAKNNVIIDNYITTMYQNNYHCNQNNYPADVLCQNFMNEILKNVNDPDCVSYRIIDKLIKTKYNIQLIRE